MGFEDLLLGFHVAVTPYNVMVAVLGVALGTIIGVLPGLGGANGVAILLPLTFTMPPTSAIILLTSIYWGALFGGAITSVLFNIPGEPWSVATTFDGYPMAQQGRAGEALTGAFTSSFFGALIAVVILTHGIARVDPPSAFGKSLYRASVTAPATSARIAGCASFKRVAMARSTPTRSRCWPRARSISSPARVTTRTSRLSGRRHHTTTTPAAIARSRRLVAAIGGRSRTLFELISRSFSSGAYASISVALEATRRARASPWSMPWRDGCGCAPAGPGGAPGPSTGAIHVRGREADRGMRKGEPGLWQPDLVQRVECGHGQRQRLPVGHADVLGREDHHAAGDEPGVLPRLQHAQHPVDGRVGIRAAQRLDERTDDVVVLVGRLVVAEAAHGVGDVVQLEVGGPVGTGDRLRGHLEARECRAGVAVADGDKVLEGVVVQRPAAGQAALVLQRALQQRAQVVVGERLQPDQLAA